MSLLTTQLNRESFLKALNLAKPALATQSFIPVLSHICFTPSGLFAYNDAQAIWVKSETGIECALPGDLLIKVVSSFSSDSLSLACDSSEVVITSGRSRIKLPMLGSDQFIFTPSAAVDLDLEFTLDSSFLTGLECCLMSVGSDPTRPNLLGITLLQSPEGWSLFSTDNVTISRFVSKRSAEGQVLRRPVVLPALFCQQVVALAKAFPDSQLTFGINEREVTVASDKALVYSKLISGVEPLDFQRVISSYLVDSSSAPVPLVDSFLPALERSVLLSSGSDEPTCQIRLEGKVATLITESSAGHVRDQVTFSEQLDSIDFRVDPNLALRAVKVCSHVTTPDRVLIFSGAKGTAEDFLHLVAHRRTAVEQ